MDKTAYQPLLTDEVKAAISTTPIIDIRPASFYAEGHIPTSINIPFNEVAPQGEDWQPYIVQAIEKAGFGPEDEFIVSCQTGYHSKLACDALFNEGFTKVLYHPGSFEDWVLDPSNPVEK